MKIIKKIFFIFSLTLLSCKSTSDDKVIVPKEEKNQWSELEIRVEYNRTRKNIAVYQQDTCYYTVFDFSDTIYYKKHEHFPWKGTKFVLSRQERDSLFFYAEQAITKPAFTEGMVTDYAGEYVSISLKHSSTRISCGYSSVMYWTSISPTLLKINNLTFKKVKASADK